MKNSVTGNKKLFAAALVLAGCMIVQERAEAGTIAPAGNTGNTVTMTGNEYELSDGKKGTLPAHESIAGANQDQTNKSATNNKVTASGTIDVANATIYGGIAKGKVSLFPGGSTVAVTADENEVTIKAGANSKFNTVIGGEGTNGASNNKVTIDNMGQLDNEIYGGSATQGNTNENEVTLTKVGKSSATIVGGFSQNAFESIKNKVTIEGKEGSNLGYATIIGGQDGNKADSNEVHISKVEKLGKVYGGLTTVYGAGNASHNKVDIKGTGETILTLEIQGGKGNNSGEANDNHVTIEGVKTSGATIHGGKSGSAGKANENSVTFTGTGETEITAEIYGGEAGKEASKNKVEITNFLKTSKMLHGGYASNGLTKGNELTITGNEEGTSRLVADVHGGYSKLSGNAEGNTIVIKDIQDSYDIYGGRADSGSAKGNTVHVIGENNKIQEISKVAGGYAGNGSANENTVYIKNAAVHKVYGGQADTIEAKGNKVYLEDVQGIYSNSDDAFYGGWSYKQSQDNMVAISGNTDLSKVDLYGGYAEDNSAVNGEAGSKGNVLRVGQTLVMDPTTGEMKETNKAFTGNKVKKIQNFETIEFHGVKWDTETPTITLLEQSNLGNTKFDTNDIYFTNLQEVKDTLEVGNKMTLIDTVDKNMNINKDNIIDDKPGTKTMKVGTAFEIKVNGEAKVEENSNKSGNNLIYEIGKITIPATPITPIDPVDPDNGGTDNGGTDNGGTDNGNTDNGNTDNGNTDNGGTVDPIDTQDQTHNTVIGNVAGLVTLNAGQNYVENGLNSIADENKYGVKFYIAGSAGNEKYDTGSHLNTEVNNGVVGLGDIVETKNGKFGYMGFYEYGTGDYEVFNEGGEKGHGDIMYQGLALSTKYQLNNGVYGELIARGGHVENDAKDVLVDGSGKGYDYKTSGQYLGGQIGIGKVTKLSDMTTVDTYGKYVYMNVDSDDFRLDGVKEHYELDAVENSIVKIGSKVTYNMNGWQFYYGGAVETEYAGKAEGTVTGSDGTTRNIESADIGGTSLMGEIGVILKPSRESAWTVDANLKGYAGKHKGCRGNIGVTYFF